MTGGGGDSCELKEAWLPDIPVDDVKAMYADGHSQQDISDRYGVEPWDISNFMRYHGIPRRSKREAQMNRYGRSNLSVSFDRSVVDGMLASDAYVNQKGSSHPYIVQSFAEKYREYALLVKDLLETFGCPATLSESDREHGIEYEVVSASVEELEPYARRWYSGGEKSVPRDVSLDPGFLTHWYLGDGQLKRDDQAVLHTNSFPRDDVEWMADRLWDRYGLGAYTKEYDSKNQPGEYVVVLRAADAGDFLDMMNHRPECFSHKFDYDGDHSRRKWLEVENEYIKENYGKMSTSKIASELNRTKVSIYHQANRLGVEA